MSRPAKDPGVFDALPSVSSPYEPPPTEPPVYDPPVYDPQRGPAQQGPAGKSSSWGCLWGGCLGGMLILLVLVVVTGFGTYRYYKKQIGEFTSEEARPIPVAEVSPEELEELETRIETFQETVEQGEAPEPLVLNSDDLNALISQEEKLRGRVFVTIKDGLIQAEMSVPTDALPGAEGRYFNGSASFNASLIEGELIVTLDSAEVNGHVVPDGLMKSLREQNLAKEVNKNPEIVKLIDQFDGLVIEGDKLILTPKPSEPGEVDPKVNTDPSVKSALFYPTTFPEPQRARLAGKEVFKLASR